MFITKFIIVGFLLIAVSLSAQESPNLRNAFYSQKTVNNYLNLQACNQLKGIDVQFGKYFPPSLDRSVENFTTSGYSKKYASFTPDSLFLKEIAGKYNSSVEDPERKESNQSPETKESEKPEYTFQPDYNPFTRFGKDLWMQASAPFKMKGTDFLWLGAGTIITAGLIATDQSSYNYIHKGTERTSLFRKTSPEVTEFGANYGLLSLGAFAGYSLFFNDRKAQETSFLAFEAFLTSSVWVVGIKWITSRQRPSAQEESQSAAGGKWSGPVAYFRTNPKKSITNYDAFPSGHTATAFSIATVIAKQYDQTLFVPILSYAAASIVGITRIGESTHWASDVFVGAVLGYLSATQIVHNNPSQYTRDHRVRNKFLSKVKTSFTLGMYESSPALLFKASF
ncbi:MAG: phosphatase PAP2 family protein [Ignavibacteria bacterium]